MINFVLSGFKFQPHQNHVIYYNRLID